MDGNNRWSKKKKISLFNGYKHGANNLFNLTEFIFKKYDIKYVSAFALSKNNLNRKSSVINSIKKTLSFFINKYSKENLLNFKISFIGDLGFLEEETIQSIKKIEKFNIQSKKILLIFINYSGRFDILNAAKYYNLKKNSSINFQNLLSTKNVPNPELLIRTGGYSRLSDFMLFQIAFTELFFIKKLWPDLSKYDIKKIIDSYFETERKFGF